jgi:hypothetical protein
MGGNSVPQTSFVVGLETSGVEGSTSSNAHFMVTAPVFEATALPASEIPVIATVATIPDARTAAYWIHERGAVIPEALLARIDAGEGESVAQEIAKALRKHVAGIRAVN